jgi:hypothetical protein
MTEKENEIKQETMVDEELLTAFFAPSKELQVADDGFTDSVMRSLPEAIPMRQRLVNGFWTLLCVAACIAIFFVNDGIALLKEGLVSGIGSIASALSQTLSKVDVSALLSSAIPDNALYTAPLIAVGALTIVGVVTLYGVMQSE